MPNYESREVRGYIMKTLHRAYPYEVSDVQVSELLKDVGFHVSPAVVAGHLMYLEEKEYIDVDEAKAVGMMRVMAKLRPKGIDLIEGSIGADPGVKILE